MAGPSRVGAATPEAPSPPAPTASTAIQPDIPPAGTDGRAAPGANWVAMQPRPGAGTEAVAAPVPPITAPLDPPSAPPAADTPVAPPAAAVTVLRTGEPDERVVVPCEPRAERAADRKPKRADQPRRAERPRVVDTGEADVVIVDAPEIAPPSPPALRDAGALRGF